MTHTRDHHRPLRKTRKSYTLSPESVEFLENLRKQRRSPSVSSILDEILLGIRREQAKAAVETAIARYYGSLSDKEISEQAGWSDFAMSQFPREEA